MASNSLLFREKKKYSNIVCSDGLNYIRSSMFTRSKPKVGCSSLINKR